MGDMLSAMFTMGVPLAEKVIRTIVVYGALLIGLRVFGKRELGQWNPADLIIVLLLSDTVEDAIIGDDHSLTGGLIGAAVLLLANHLLVRFTFRSQRGRRAIDGTPDDLMKDGHVVEEALERNQVSREEMALAARRQGIENLSHVRHARLEIDGDITFFRKEDHDPESLARRIEARLARIEERLTVPS